MEHNYNSMKIEIARLSCSHCFLDERRGEAGGGPSRKRLRKCGSEFSEDGEIDLNTQVEAATGLPRASPAQPTSVREPRSPQPVSAEASNVPLLTPLLLGSVGMKSSTGLLLYLTSCPASSPLTSVHVPT